MLRWNVEDKVHQILELLEGYDYLELRKIVGNKLITTTVQEMDNDNDDD
jgi:hypothetical protein